MLPIDKHCDKQGLGQPVARGSRTRSPVPRRGHRPDTYKQPKK